MAKAWGGRFEGKTDPRVEKFTESISFDARLAAVDVQGSQAHAQMLSKVGLLSAAECDSICKTLATISEEIARGEFAFQIELEDIHMHIESELIKRIGDVGRKLHTGRSRRTNEVPLIRRAEAAASAAAAVAGERRLRRPASAPLNPSAQFWSRLHSGAPYRYGA